MKKKSEGKPKRLSVKKQAVIIQVLAPVGSAVTRIRETPRIRKRSRIQRSPKERTRSQSM